MAIIKAKPTSAGRRHVIQIKSFDLWKGGPFAPLVVEKRKTGGRDNYGHISTRHIGGGHKQRYRLIDFKRQKDGIEARVERLEYDPNRSAHIALVLYTDGERRYILAPKGLKVGDKIMSMIRFAKDCVDDRKYQEANEIYDWLWEMSVSADSEYSDPVDLEMMDENDLIHKAAAGIAAYVGFTDTKEEKNLMEFEREILEESREHKVREFWNYFQRWKRYFPMDENEKKRYLSWAEKIVYGRADAIISGQHRNHYGQVAILLAMVGEIKEGMGDIGARRIIFADYKRKFPRHSSFQREMKEYFNEV